MRDAIDFFFFAYWFKVLLFEEATDNLLIVIFQELVFLEVIFIYSPFLLSQSSLHSLLFNSSLFCRHLIFVIYVKKQFNIG